MTSAEMVGLAVAGLVLLSGCGTAKEKTAPCKRPANLMSFAPDPREDCGAMYRVNNPAAAFAALGIVEPDGQ
ncbi:hypothetical protein HGP14_27820 [Rhizobium sp. P32RR-XVIII]|uniref:hypothetical protein n=1 Tax=Rhizobium sp. P32RR-XVIII TaxID=2726738 RepID=UPI0014566F47|nr:hypothetical protein [Rhizobium sp. P32RR-XVIII]NLS07111.1 hypothetical protein [Rhizobium sp. P32RR-XVIII]